MRGTRAFGAAGSLLLCSVRATPLLGRAHSICSSGPRAAWRVWQEAAARVMSTHRQPFPTRRSIKISLFCHAPHPHPLLTIHTCPRTHARTRTERDTHARTHIASLCAAALGMHLKCMAPAARRLSCALWQRRASRSAVRCCLMRPCGFFSIGLCARCAHVWQPSMIRQSLDHHAVR